MFSKLLSLYSKNSKKTPVEDFTTEIFVGVLNNDKELKNIFCKDFLNLKSSNYIISTQKHYYLKNEPKCIVDVVIESDKEICFIENKVNSKEGYNQLQRYSKVLDSLKKEKKKETILCYCTKKYDNKEIKEHHFYQFKWHNIAVFFNKNSNQRLTTLFINFLKTNDMANEMIIEPADLITLEKVTKTLNLVQRNILNVKSIFNDKYEVSIDCTNGKKMLDQLNDNDRICIVSESIIKGEGYSEILYGFETTGKLVIQIYISIENKNHNNFNQLIKNRKDNFKCETFDHGSRIYLEKNLGEYINDENSENKIEKWFLDGFILMDLFIEETTGKIEWNK